MSECKARRRQAELKLDAAQITSRALIDIVFEVENPARTLKRQAAKARRLEPARGTPPLGEGALHAQVSSACRDDRVGADTTGRRVSAGDGNRRPCVGDRSDFRTFAYRTGGSRVALDGGA